MASRPGFDLVVLGFLFVAAVVIDGAVLFIVEPAGTRLFFGLLLSLPIMWPVVWMTRQFGLIGKVTEIVTDRSRRRQFLKLRSITVQILEGIKRLNWLAVDAKRGLRKDEDIAADLKAVKRRLHELVDQMPAAAGVSEPEPDDSSGESSESRVGTGST